jgi:site-specific DNA-cytosine methylase
LGDINNWKDWQIEKPDLIIAGSPCVGFSSAGKGLNFEDPRSKLFFVFLDILKHYNPEYFLLENVKMKKEWSDKISEYLNTEYISINSALLSAQNRQRLYWTNIPDVIVPDDKGILLKDIIDTGVVDRDKSYCIDANYYKGGPLKSYFERKRRQVVFQELNSGAIRQRPFNESVAQCLEVSINNKKAYCLTTLSKNNLVTNMPPGSYEDIYNHSNCIRIGDADLNGHDYCRRVYDINGKSPALNTCNGGNREPKISEDYYTWRILTPMECEKLQTMPISWTEYGIDIKGKLIKISKSQRMKALGNGFTCDVIAHILKHIEVSNG